MKYLILVVFLTFGSLKAQSIAENSRKISISPLIDGTILVPKTTEAPPLAILIGDSGPTDRNGNQQMMENNCLRYLAEGLYKDGIASFRYDKRIVKQMKNRSINEEHIRFDDFIKDAKDVVAYFKRANSFGKIYIIGHGQGSLVGMVAAQKDINGFISIAGAGQSIDEVIISQLANQAPELQENASQAFDELRASGSTQKYSPGLASIFRPAIQSFIRSWMLYNPQEGIATLNIPVLIMNGDKDIQVAVSEAEILQKAKPGATYTIIPNMNHVLKEIKGKDPLENQKTYNDYKMPVMPQLINEISRFIKQK
jgi:alpha-beta hydrolase superfamily lysophospholipase